MQPATTGGRIGKVRTGPNNGVVSDSTNNPAFFNNHVRAKHRAVNGVRIPRAATHNAAANRRKAISHRIVSGGALRMEVVRHGIPHVRVSRLGQFPDKSLRAHLCQMESIYRTQRS